MCSIHVYVWIWSVQLYPASPPIQHPHESGKHRPALGTDYKCSERPERPILSESWPPPVSAWLTIWRACMGLMV